MTVRPVGIGITIVVALVVQSCIANITVYTTRAAFADANPALRAENFDVPFESASVVAFPLFVASTEASTRIEHFNGDKLVRRGLGNTENSITFSFGRAVFAFAIDISDFGNRVSSGDLRVSTDTGSIDDVISHYEQPQPEIAVFFGLRDDVGFSAITFRNTTIGDAIFFDAVQIARVRCAGDLNGNGAIDLGDLAILLSQFGSTNADEGDGDFNGDSDVSLDDLNVLLRLFGSPCE